MKKIKLIKGDITKLQVDAIVNAANSSLLGGGGVDGAIHRAGGPSILEECIEIGGCPTGEAVITKAGNLPSKYVIHTVGPIWKGGNNHEEELLKNAYNNCLKLARENGLKSIAFPNISTGVYGFPKDKAARIAVETIQKFLNTHTPELEVTFICFDDVNHEMYEHLLATSSKNL